MSTVFSFKMSADPNSLMIMRNDLLIGYVQKHEGREPQIMLKNAYTSLSIRELELCLQKLKEFTGTI